MVGQDAGDGDPRSDGGARSLTPTPRSSRLMSTVISASAGESGFRHGDRDLRLAIQVSKAHGNQAIEQCVLGLMHARVFFRVRGENGAKFRVNVQVALA